LSYLDSWFGGGANSWGDSWGNDVKTYDPITKSDVWTYTPFDYEKEYKTKIIEKTTKIFSELMSKPINLSLQEGSDCKIRNQENGYSLVVGQEEDYKITTKTRVERALSHVLLKSPNLTFQNMIQQMTKKIPTKYGNEVEQIAHGIYNAFEDRRCDAGYGQIYRGAGQRIIKTREQEAQRYEPIKVVNPVQAIQMAERGRTEKLKGTKYKKAEDWIKKAENLTPEGLLQLVNQYYKKEVEPWLLDLIKKIEAQPKSPQGGKGKGKDKKGKGKEESKSSGGTGESKEPMTEKEEDEAIEKQIQKTKEANKKNPNEKAKCECHDCARDDLKKKQDPSDKANEMLDKGETMTPEEKKERDAQNRAFNKLRKQVEEIQRSRRNADHEQLADDQEMALKADIKKLLAGKIDFNKEKKKSEENLEKIEAMLDDLSENVNKEMGYTDVLGAGSVTVSDNNKTGTYCIDNNLARKLSKTFKRVKGTSGKEITDSGDSIDIGACIEREVQGFGEYLLEDKTEVGFDIVIGVDESGSMRREMQTIRDLVATLYTALAQTKNVKLKVIGWTDSYNDLSIHRIEKLEDVKALYCSGGTPLGKAMWFCKKEIEGMTGRKKMVVHITDGSPNDGMRDVERGKNCVQQLRRNKTACMGIRLGYTKGTKVPVMESIFGKQGYTCCADMEEAGEYLVKEFANKIIKHLKGL